MFEHNSKTNVGDISVFEKYFGSQDQPYERGDRPDQEIIDTRAAIKDRWAKNYGFVL